jgi:formate hydrogenlyase subunit 3/multisubunit Na+/H+ antiporter MnhD subunit
MINKIIFILKKLSSLWLLILGVLTCIVGFFCIDARIHPHEKGISKIDLLDYMYVSVTLIFLYLTCKIISLSLSKRNNLKNSN